MYSSCWAFQGVVAALTLVWLCSLEVAGVSLTRHISTAAENVQESRDPQKTVTGTPDFHPKKDMPGHVKLEQCQRYAMKGHCQFYSCLDKHLSCGSAKNSRTVAHKFCNNAKHYKSRFTDRGLVWARKTNRCVMKQLLSDYETHSDSWCMNVDQLAKEAFVQCAQQLGVCQALRTERDVLSSIFSKGSWMTLVEAARDCPTELVNSFIFWNIDLMGRS